MNPLDKQKKDYEEMLLTKFISKNSLGKVITSIEPSETPDFRVKTVDSKISIEVTRVINPQLKKEEAAQKRIVSDALSHFKKIRNDKLRVFVNFTSKALEYNNLFLRKLSFELLDFVNTICQNNEGLHFSIKTSEREIFNDYFRSISISNELDFENWQPFGAHLVPFIDENWFKKRIEKKENRIEAYRETYDENWLLLYSDFGHKSSAFRFDYLTESYQGSKFDKIYVYQYFRDKLIVIK